MTNKRIFIFEFVSGGGFNNIEIPLSLFCEGFAMLRSIIADFKDLNFEIGTLLDNRIISLSQYLKASYTIPVDINDNYIEKYKEQLTNCEYCFIIAPESSNTLYFLTEIAHNMKKNILSINLEGIKLSSSKFNIYKFFKSFNILTPLTFSIPTKKNSLDLEFIIQKFDEINKPIIIKPDDGVGAEFVNYFENKEQIIKFFQDSKKKIDLSRRYILQEFVRGRDLSVSIIRTETFEDIIKTNTIILSVNAQVIDIKHNGSESQYIGGYTPVEDHLKIKEQLHPIIEKLDLTAFKGYFGIDFIKKPDGTFNFIEINPRLTTSYIGIRNSVKFNPIELILKKNAQTYESSEMSYHYFSRFFHLKLNYIGNETAEEINYRMIPKLIEEIPEIITPPINFIKNNKLQSNTYSCFIATKTRNFKSSEKRIKQIIRTLQNVDFYPLNR